MKRWNKADRLLGFVMGLFCIFLLLKLHYPEQLLFKALFFASEAALVGGVADWFAVTALFKKPLGFPYHTALLPRKREKFTRACVRMVQDEFFSKKKLLGRIKKLNLLALLFEWMERNRGKEAVAGIILQSAETMLDQIDRDHTAAVLEREALNLIRSLPPEEIERAIGRWLTEQNRYEEIFDQLLAEVQKKLEQPETKLEIWDFLQDYMEQRSKDFVTILFTLAAQLSNIINFEEAAEVLQQQLLKLTKRLLDRQEPLRRQVLEQLKESVAALIADEHWRALAADWQADMGTRLTLKNQIANCLTVVLAELKRDTAVEPNLLPAVQTPLAQIVIAEIARGIELIQTDPELQQTLEHFLYDLVGRSVLQAQDILGVIVSEVLQGLSDEEMNRLIYRKIEPDLLWIRMNGSIVGAIIGLGIFGVLELMR